MDNVTHTLVGAALGQAGLKKRTGLGMATLMIAANLPDLDVLAIPFGDSLTFRRGWTHGSLSILVLPLLLTVCMVGWDRLQARRNRRPPARAPVLPGQVLLLSIIGFATHPFLDWLNNYGIRLLMPFSHEWFYGDAVFIIDPWIWLVLILALVFSRRRERRAAPHARMPAAVALVAVSIYIGLMVTGSSAAEQAATEYAGEENLEVEQLMTGPVPVNPFERQIIYDVGDAYLFGRLRWTPRPDIRLEAGSLPKNFEHAAVRIALREPSIQGFLYWSRFPFFEVEALGEEARVHVGDARYTRTAASGWASRRVIVSGPSDP
ncbi:MAG: metal-dependent hydrolase [Bacteroidota bacterium]